MTDDDLNQRKYELDLKRFTLEEKRLELEQERVRRERKFLTRNIATLVTGLMSLATITVSGAVAYNAYRQTDQTRIIEDAKLEHARIEADRRWRNDALQYTTAQYESIFSGETDRQVRILSLMEMVFPKDIYERTIAHLKVAAPTKDGPNVWARAEQQADKQDLSSDVPVATISLTGRRLTVDVIRQQLYSPDRRSISDALIEQYTSGNKTIVPQLIAAVLPEEDNRSYRTNLYVAYTLARIPGKWEGDNADAQRIASLKSTANYKDPTFAQWVDKALANAQTR